MTLDEITAAIEAARTELEAYQAERSQLLADRNTYVNKRNAWSNTPNPNNPEPTHYRAVYSAMIAQVDSELADVQAQIELLEAQVTNLTQLQQDYVSASAEAASMGLTGEAAEVYAQGKLSEEKQANMLKYALYAGGALLIISIAFYFYKKARK